MTGSTMMGWDDAEWTLLTMTATACARGEPARHRLAAFDGDDALWHVAMPDPASTPSRPLCEALALAGDFGADRLAWSTFDPSTRTCVIVRIDSRAAPRPVRTGSRRRLDLVGTRWGSPRPVPTSVLRSGVVDALALVAGAAGALRRRDPEALRHRIAVCSRRGHAVALGPLGLRRLDVRRGPPAHLHGPTPQGRHGADDL